MFPLKSLNLLTWVNAWSFWIFTYLVDSNPFCCARKKVAIYLVTTRRVGLNDGSLKLKNFYFPRCFIQLSIKAVETDTTMHSRKANISVKDDLFDGTSCFTAVCLNIQHFLSCNFDFLCCKHQLDTNIIWCSQKLTAKERKCLYFSGAPPNV